MQQGQYPIGSRVLAPADTLTGVVTSQTADVPLSVLLAYVYGGQGALTQAQRIALGVAAQGANNDITGLQALTNIGGGQLAGLRNRLINGTFEVNQRVVSGTVTLAAGVYGHDGWKAGAGGCTYTFATALNLTTITITAGTLLQVIPGSYLDSLPYVLSWQGTAQGRINAGSYGASGAQFTATGGTDVSVEFSTGTLRLPQFEPGSTPTIFERRPGLELSLCQTRLQIVRAAIGLQATSTIAWRLSTRLSVTMRANPTVSLVGTVTVQPGAASPVTLSSINTNFSTPTSLQFDATMGASAAANGSPCILKEDSTGYILLSAEP